MKTLPVATSSVAEIIGRLKALVLDSVTSPQSKRAYGRALDHFLSWFQTAQPPAGFTKATVQSYRAYLLESGLSSSTTNLYITGVRRLAAEAADNGLLQADLAAGIARVRGIRREGVRIGNWLTARQAETLINTPNITRLKGKRDTALLAVLIGCGIRREETACLTLEHIQQREGRWVIVDMLGKGRRVRSVPMPSWAKAAIDVWTASAGFNSGRLFRPVNKGDRLCGESMTAQSIFEAVRKYADEAGFDQIRPHDLRRSFARLAHKGHSPIEQIQISLGHQSLETSQKYIGVQQDLNDAPCDHLGLRLSSAGAGGAVYFG
jgi:site-specific recombinase XerD